MKLGLGPGAGLGLGAGSVEGFSTPAATWFTRTKMTRVELLVIRIGLAMTESLGHFCFGTVVTICR